MSCAKDTLLIIRNYRIGKKDQSLWFQSWNAAIDHHKRKSPLIILLWNLPLIDPHSDGEDIHGVGNFGL